MGIKDNLSSMYDQAADSAVTIGKKVSSTAKEYGTEALDIADKVSDNEAFKMLVVDKDDPVDVALTAASAVPLAGVGAVAAKVGYKGAKLAKAATKVFKSDKVVDAASVAGKTVSKGADEAINVFNRGTQAAKETVQSGMTKAGDWFSDVGKSAGDIWDSTKKVAGETISSGTKKAGEVWDATKKATGDTVSSGMKKAEEAWDTSKKMAGEAIDTGKKKLGETWDATKKVAGDIAEAGKNKLGDAWDTTKDLAKKTWGVTKRVAGAGIRGAGKAANLLYKGGKRLFSAAGKLGSSVLAGLGLSKLFGGGDSSGGGEGTIGDAGGGIGSQGTLGATRSQLPQVIPTAAEHLETNAATLKPSVVSSSGGKGGEGGGNIRDILEKIYMVLQQTNATVEKISSDTGNILRHSSARDVSADLANANILARSGEGSGGGSPVGYSQVSGGSEKEPEEGGLLSTLMKGLGVAGIAGSAMATSGEFDEGFANIEDKIKQGYQTFRENLGEDGIGQAGAMKKAYKKIKGFLGFGDEEKGPDVSRVSKELMPETTKSLEKEEMMGSIDKSGKYSPSIVDKTLGSISAKYESGNRGSSAIGYDTKGGTSYGKYQIAGKTGTMDNFIKYLEQSGNTEAAQRLKASGPADTGSKHGQFVDTWQQLVKEGKITEETQHGFIQKTHYDPAAKKAEQLGFKMGDAGIRDAIWSGSVQHGGIKKILEATSKREGFKDMSAEDQIKAYYEERTKYAGKNSPIDVSGRYKQEVKDAIAKSKQSQGETQLAAKDQPKTAQELIAEEMNKSQQPQLAAKEKTQEDIVINPPEKPEMQVASAETQVPRNPGHASQSQQTTPSDNMRSAGQAGQNVNNPPLGNVRDDDPLILSMQYSNLRTV
jgi:hypothetical protein